jgi:cytochrome c oxidase subunit III
MSTVSSSEHKFHHAHHFDSADHQYSSSKQGIWLFMATEILMFGGLFVGYLIYKSLYPEVFKAGSTFLDVRLGASNTVILILSSFTMALGIYFNQINKPKQAAIALAITIACACGFMGIKYVEYSHKFHIGLIPGTRMTNPDFPEKIAEIATKEHQDSLTKDELNARIKELKKFAPMYLGFYFVMTGLHGTHVLIGMGLILWVMIKTLRGSFSNEYYTPVEGVGIFWHIVDLIWIYLFPLLYLVG